MIKPKILTRAEINNVVIPPRTESYTPISCKLIFDTVDRLAEEFKIVLTGEQHLLSSKGKVQRLRFFFSKNGDFTKELVVLNSYDKSLALRAASGTNVYICSNGVIVGDIKIYRKHTSDVDLEIEGFIRDCMQDMINQEVLANDYKEKFSNLIVDEEFIGTTLGRFFFEFDCLSSTQLNMIKAEFKKPSFDYGVHPMSLWAFYQHVTYALTFETAHDYLDNRTTIQKYFADYYWKATQPFSEFEIIEVDED